MVLYVKLAKTGGVVLSGDLYHYPAERTLNRLPAFEVSEDQTKAAREELERFLSRTGADRSRRGSFLTAYRSYSAGFAGHPV
jgi:hypothetical protein